MWEPASLKKDEERRVYRRFRTLEGNRRRVPCLQNEARKKKQGEKERATKGAPTDRKVPRPTERCPDGKGTNPQLQCSAHLIPKYTPKVPVGNGKRMHQLT